MENFFENEISLNAQRAAFIANQKVLIISDCHLGKAAHFRKNALPLSPMSQKKDLQRIMALMEFYQPEKLYFLGDLFHSEWNQEWESFAGLMQQIKNCDKILVKGNHDILRETDYEDAGMEVTEQGRVGNLLLLHDYPETNPELPVICGHVHPGYRIRGIGRQSAMLPCFHFNSKRLLMPAFGGLTGLVHVEKEDRNDRIICFTESRFYNI
jgi:DNA ligase-associated metallophosphoesterase